MDLNKTVLKNYLVNPLHKSISSFNINPSYFVQGYDEIFMDEEYMDEMYQFIKCYSCNSKNIKEVTLVVKDLQNFLQKKHSSEYITLSNDISKLKLKDDDFITIRYCEDCNAILNICKVPYIFHFTNFESLENDRYFLFEDDEDIIFNKNNVDIKFCPKCRQRVSKENVYFEEVYEAEYELVCKHCGYKILFYYL